MKLTRNHLIVLACALALFILQEAPVMAQQTCPNPGGSYSETCFDCKYEPGTSIYGCRCEGGDGSQPTTFNMSNCTSCDLMNDNGNLACVIAVEALCVEGETPKAVPETVDVWIGRFALAFALDSDSTSGASFSVSPPTSGPFSMPSYLGGDVMIDVGPQSSSSQSYPYGVCCSYGGRFQCNYTDPTIVNLGTNCCVEEGSTVGGRAD